MGGTELEALMASSGSHTPEVLIYSRDLIERPDWMKVGIRQGVTPGGKDH